MKRRLFIALFIMVSSACLGQNLKALDEKYGFREAKFEMPFDSFKNLVEVEENWYKSTTEDLKIGDYALDQVEYRFYKGKLAMIYIKTKGNRNTEGFLNILKKAYGNGQWQKGHDHPEILWVGEKVILSFSHQLDPYNVSNTKDFFIPNDAAIIFKCIKLVNQEELDNKKSDSEAAKKLL